MVFFECEPLKIEKVNGAQAKKNRLQVEVFALHL